MTKGVVDKLILAQFMGVSNAVVEAYTPQKLMIVYSDSQLPKYWGFGKYSHYTIVLIPILQPWR
jgi:hypothetical protein